MHGDLSPTLDMTRQSHTDWQPFCETLGFVLRRVTRRRFLTYPQGASSPPRATENVIVEFDLLTGWEGGYAATGIWALDGATLTPTGEPACAPLSFRGVLAAPGVGANLAAEEAQSRLLAAIREWMTQRPR